MFSVFLSFPVQGTTDSDDYTESYEIIVHWCHYLEYIHEFTNHTFLVKILSNSTSSNYMFTLTGRYLLTDISFLLNSSTERYIQINFEIYEIVNDSTFPCDLDTKEGIGFPQILFDTYTGHWTGDDELYDVSGYGRLNGCDDANFDTFERDFEVGFSIHTIDPDGDGVPRWIEENVYGTNPLVNDADRDDDSDEIPLSWEWNYGYDPFKYDDHRNIDPDNDGLTNYEEYLVSSWRSDPFRKDIFLELDQMEPESGKNGFMLAPATTIMVYQTFAQRNIVFHVDDGCMGGGEILPFDPIIWFGEEKKYYNNYFLHNDPDNWRRGVFRYALYVNNHFPIYGMEFPGENTILQFFKPGLNSFVISTKFFGKKSYADNACVMLHELGHTLGIYMGHPPGCDNQLMRNPFSLQRILFRNYQSVMNYLYTYEILDYSDGSHGLGDSNDWEKMDVTFFQPADAE